MYGYNESTSEFVSNRLTYATQRVSDVAEKTVVEADKTLQDAFNSTSMWAQDKLVDMVETISLPRHLLASIEDDDEELDDVVKRRFEKFGQPDMDIKYEHDNDVQFAV